ncbi:MAG: PQQ-binding-like beta-propeller repeat protein [Sedimentisphaerales bacterium]
MVRFRLALGVIGVSFFIFCAVPKSIAVEDDLQHLVSPELLKQAELEILWENKLPIRAGESLEQLFIPFDCAQGRLGNRIYGLSSQNFMVSMNREKGNVIFSRSIAEAGLPVVGLGLYKDELFSVAGNKLVEIDAGSGEERGDKRLKFGVACPAARNGSYFYVGGTDRRVHTLRSKDKIQVFEAAAEDDSVITSIVADENSVIFATKAGDVISITPDKSERLWQFNAAEGIAWPIVRDAESLFVASGDTNVYRIDARTGKLIWKYQTAAKLEKGPRVTERIVYQYVRDEGLVAIDKESHERIWQLAEGVDLLAEADGKSYVITKAGTLVVMDSKKAKQLCSVDLAGVSRYATNVADSRIYIADKSGRIACLQPIKY